MTQNDCKISDDCKMLKRCAKAFMSRAEYFKDKFTMLAAVLGSSLVIIIVLVGFSMKQNSDIAILKSQMKDIKEIVINPDKIGFHQELQYYLRDGGK